MWVYICSHSHPTHHKGMKQQQYDPVVSRRRSNQISSKHCATEWKRACVGSQDHVKHGGRRGPIEIDYLQERPASLLKLLGIDNCMVWISVALVLPDREARTVPLLVSKRSTRRASTVMVSDWSTFGESKALARPKHRALAYMIRSTIWSNSKGR